MICSFVLLAGTTLPVLAGANKESAKKRPIVVGSKIDTEGALLGNMIKLALQHAGFTVEDKIQTGPTAVVRKAIIAGEIDIYPEYTGNGNFFYSGKTDPNIWKNHTSAYQTVKKLDFENHKIVWLTPAPANNTWAIAIRSDVAQKNTLKTLADLAKYINANGDFKIAASEEFATRKDALPAFEKAYDFTLKNSQLQTVSSGNTALTEKAAASGNDGVNAAMAYGTDGQLAALGLVVLTDSLGVQPVYQPAPIVRNAIISKYPEIKSILDPIFKTLNLVTLQKLNSAIAVDGGSPEQVAKTYLTQKRFL